MACATLVEVEAGVESWHRSDTFVFKLACLGADGRERARVSALVEMELVLSDRYTITGFQEENEAEALEALIEINSLFFLSLAGEAVGRVLGLPFQGPPVTRLISSDKKEEVIQMLFRSRRACYQHFRRGVLLNDFQNSQFKEFLVQQSEKLLIQAFGGADDNWVRLAHAYFLKREFFNGAQHNWAAYRALHVMKMLKSGKLLSRSPMSLLLRRYIEAASPAVRGIYLEMKAVPRERARRAPPAALPPKRMSAKRQSKRLSEREEAPGANASTRRSMRSKPSHLDSPERDSWHIAVECKEEPGSGDGEEEFEAGGADSQQEAAELVAIAKRRYTKKKKKNEKKKKQIKSKHDHFCGTQGHDEVHLESVEARRAAGEESVELKELRDEMNTYSKVALDFAKQLVDLQGSIIVRYQQRAERSMNRRRELEQERREFEEEKERFQRKRRRATSRKDLEDAELWSN